MAVKTVINATKAPEIVLTFPVEYRKMVRDILVICCFGVHGGCQDEKN